MLGSEAQPHVKSAILAPQPDGRATGTLVGLDLVVFQGQRWKRCDQGIPDRRSIPRAHNPKLWPKPSVVGEGSMSHKNAVEASGLSDNPHEASLH
jgi:hypothetical protein